MGFFDKRKKEDEKEKDGSFLAGMMAVWHALPISAKLSIIGGLAGIVLLIVIAVVICSIPLIFLNYSDDASTSQDLKNEYEQYWIELCEDQDAGCSEEQIEAAKELKKSQEEFYKKLNSLTEKNHLTEEQKYIVLTTIFYNYEIDDFTQGNLAFSLDDNDEINYDASQNEGSVYNREKDSLKELIKQFKVNTIFCSYTGKNESGEDETKTYALRSPAGKTFAINFFESVQINLGFSPKLEGYEEAKSECLSSTDGKIYTETSSNSAASIEGYYNYLRESTYLDDRPQNAMEFSAYAKNHGLSSDTTTWADEELYAVRDSIINDIKNIVATHSPAKTTNKDFIALGSETGYWWPIGGADVIESEGKKYATGDPYPYVVTSEGGGRIDPITGVAANHSGIDIAPKGAAAGVVPVIAAKSGEVVFPEADDNINYGNGSGINGSTYGNYIKIKHSDGNYTLYAHLHANTILVRKGDTVEQGQVIAYVGNSGRSTGTHLHFEVREGQDNYNSVTDPRKYIKEDDPRPQSSVSEDFVTWFDANFEGTTGTDSTGTKYLVKDVGDGVRTAGPGVTLDAQRKKFAAHGINVDDYPNGSYIDKNIVDAIKRQILEEAAASIETTLANAGLTLEKEKIEALVVFKYNVGNISGFVDAYKQYGDTQELYDNYFGQYIHVKGEVWPGLIKRRQKEWELFHNHVYV